MRRDQEQYASADTNLKLILNLRDIGHVMHRLYEGRASQKRILILMTQCGPITQRDLTEMLQVQPGTASEVFAKLERAGLITRVPNTLDRRTVDLELTEEGKRLGLEAAAQRQSRHELMFAGLTDEEKEQLLRLTEKLNTDWKEKFPCKGHCRRDDAGNEHRRCHHHHHEFDDGHQEE